jgi:FAD/FMN-containing dehydrogenase
MSAGKHARIGTARVLWRDEPGYEEARRGAVWNARKPARFPEVIVTVTSDADVIEAIAFARSRGLRIAIRAGGHSMCASPVRDGGILLDLSELRALSIDPAARTAAAQPSVTSGQLSTALADHGLAFPVGHCGSVALSGYLLSGGLGWNMGAWGPACFSVEAVEVVTAGGELVTANDRENTELFWAARGSGPGFFGVATRFHLRVHPLPKAIRVSRSLYPLADVEEVSAWASETVPMLPPTVEMHVGLASAPPGAPAGPAGKAVGVLAIAFADSEEEAAQSLAVMDTCPAERALGREANEPASFEMLHRSVDATLPAGHRYIEDSIWSNEPLAVLLPHVAERLVSAPSARSFIVAAMLPPRPEGAAMPDAAFSMFGNTFLLSYAIWEDEREDGPNEAWFQDLVSSTETLSIGHYVAETNLSRGPAQAQRSFAPRNWRRLQELRAKHDPEGLFHAFLSV